MTWFGVLRPAIVNTGLVQGVGKKLMCFIVYFRRLDVPVTVRITVLLRQSVSLSHPRKLYRIGSSSLESTETGHQHQVNPVSCRDAMTDMCLGIPERCLNGA
jgi:hypothetical protein